MSGSLIFGHVYSLAAADVGGVKSLKLTGSSFADLVDLAFVSWVVSCSSGSFEVVMWDWLAWTSSVCVTEEADSVVSVGWCVTVLLEVGTVWWDVGQNLDGFVV